MLVFRSFQALNHTVCHFSHAWFNSQNGVMSFWLALMPRVYFNETHTIVQPWAVERHISPWHTALCSHNSLISNCFTPDRWVHKFPHAENINNNKCCFKNEGLQENTHDVTWLERQVQDVAVCRFLTDAGALSTCIHDRCKIINISKIWIILSFRFSSGNVLKLSFCFPERNYKLQ